MISSGFRMVKNDKRSSNLYETNTERINMKNIKVILNSIHRHEKEIE